MSRRIMAAVVTVLFVLPFGNAQAEVTHALKAEARSSVLFSIADIQPAFDPAFADSRAASSSVGTSSLQSVTWPGFLPDAFFFLYGFQSVERVALGISEALWPQGPQEATATQSDLLFLNAGSPDDVPGEAGKSDAYAEVGRAGGDTRANTIFVAGGTIDSAYSTTSVETVGAAASASARQVLTDVVFGPLVISSIKSSAIATQDAATSTLAIVDASVAGTPVVIDEDGVHAQRNQAQDAIDSALANSGISVVALPRTSSKAPGESHASSGGILIEVNEQAEDPTGTPRDVKLAYLLGAAEASASAQPVDVPAPPEPPEDNKVEQKQTFRTILRPVKTFVPIAEPPTSILRRTVIIEPAARIRTSASVAYAGLFLVAIGLLLMRPLIRAGSRA